MRYLVVLGLLGLLFNIVITSLACLLMLRTCDEILSEVYLLQDAKLECFAQEMIDN